MRVLHIQKASGIGGSERHLLVLLPALREAGVDVRMGVAASRDGERLVRAMRERGIDTFSVPAGRHVNPRLVGWARAQIRAFSPDLVHTHLIHADLHGQLAARLEGVPGVSSVHGTPPFLRRLPVGAVGAVVGRMPRITIAISAYVQRFLEQRHLLRPGTARVVHYGLDAREWAVTDASRADARARLGVAPDEVAVAITARLVAGKGHDALIDAAATVRRDVPRLRLIIAGDGPLRTEVEQRAFDRLGPDGGLMLGYVDDVRQVVWASDVVAFPTDPELGEGFGLSALEAMAAERPVLATAVGALPEVVASGESGVVVAPREAGELAAALRDLVTREELRRVMGRAGRERAEALFGVDAMVRGTLAVYDEALSA